MTTKQTEIDTGKIQTLTIEEILTIVNVFHVAPYQRGYRWGTEQVLALLNDINENADGFYCLQPIVVVDLSKADTPKKWELIDGQQRMTTIFLILHALKDVEKIYRLDYQTRKETCTYLEKIGENYDTVTNLEKNDDINNIDNRCIHNSVTKINKWLKDSEIDKEIFKNKLLQKTLLIWYPVINTDNADVNAEQVFLNLNSGKIRLNSSELIKALFIFDIEKGEEKVKESWELKEIKKQTFAQEWDAIEKGLHNDQLWYFLQPLQSNNAHTRIGLLFDLISKRDNNENSLHAYKYYSEDSERLDWDKVKQHYQTIQSWYNNIELFHRIGYLVNSSAKHTFGDLMTDLSSKRKSEVKAELEEKIKQHFKKRTEITDHNIDALTYGNKKKRTQCQDVLLWHNIITTEQLLVQQRFPFYLYQKEKWSLEHIHPQNPNEKDREEWQKGLTEMLGKEGQLTEEQKKLANEKTVEERQKELETEHSELLNTMGNLVLLDSQSNSSLSNNNFQEKRRLLLNREGNKTNYIPVATLHAFLKKYNDTTESVSLTYWTAEDSAAYQADIEKSIKDLLS